MKILTKNGWFRNMFAVAALLIASSVHAVEFKILIEEPPPKGSPADVYVDFLKAGSFGDTDKMREMAFGNTLRFLNKEETRVNIVKRAENVDWKRPIKWAQKIEEKNAKVALNYYQKDNGKLYRAVVTMTKVEDAWKRGE